MKEQLRQARNRGWCYSGVIPQGDEEWGEFASVNERRCFEGLRFASDLTKLTIKPVPFQWIDSQGVERT